MLLILGNSSSDIYPKIFHERGFQRMTSRFHAKPGVGQNIAWALTKYVNFTKIIDDLWYRDIANIQPGYIRDFQVYYLKTNMKKVILSICINSLHRVSIYKLLKIIVLDSVASQRSTFNNSNDLGANNAYRVWLDTVSFS